ncbi:MAG: hypothetical protein HPY52_13890 [Firmicutes bacterium]|nr:hypothetical protein [Bacillota bacterium]
MEKFKSLFLLMLLLPVFPVIALSPFSHAYVNRLALKRAKDEKKNGNHQINRELLQIVSAHENEFINAGNSADAISTYHILNGIDLYDYAHNCHPDNARGIPRFGYALVDEWNGNRSKYPESHLAIVSGWLAHQLADWYPHYACVKGNGELSDDPSEIADDTHTFAGFANALTIFGADLPRELRGRYKVPNHGLYELFLDVAVLASDEGKDLYGIKVNLFDHKERPYGLLTRCSERFWGQGCVRIPPEHLPSLERDFNTIIFGTGLLIRFLLRVCPNLHEDLKSFVKTDILSLAADRVVEGLFCKSWEEIQNLAGPAEPKAEGFHYQLRGLSSQQLTKPGSAIFSILYQIGGSFKADISREEIERLIDEPVEALLSKIPGVGGVAAGIEARLEQRGADLDELLYSFLLKSLRRLGASSKGNWKDQSPIIAFLSGLLLDADGDISAAREAMRRGLRPIITLGAPEEETSTCSGNIRPLDRLLPASGDAAVADSIDVSLETMFAAKKINLRCIPAIADSYTKDLRDCKELDEDTLIVRVDGFDLKENQDIGVYTVSRDSKGCLTVSIDLKADVKPGVHHLFVDVKDRCSVHSEYIDRKIVVGRAIAKGDPT